MVETDIRRTRTCEKCKAIIPFDRVRLFPKNPEKPGINLVVCDICCEKLKNISKGKLSTVNITKDGVTVNKPTMTTTEPPKPIITKPARIIKDHPERESYTCTRCNYKFKSEDDGITSLRCPYCGKSDKLKKQ